MKVFNKFKAIAMASLALSLVMSGQGIAEKQAPKNNKAKHLLIGLTTVAGVSFAAQKVCGRLGNMWRGPNSLVVNYLFNTMQYQNQYLHAAKVFNKIGGVAGVSAATLVGLGLSHGMINIPVKNLAKKECLPAQNKA